MSLNTILATTPLTSTGYHLKATGTTIGNSLIWDNGTNVGIGNTNTSYTLDVSGTGRFTGNVGIGATLSAWISTAKALQLNDTASLFGPTSEAILANNLFVDATDNNKYITTNFASQYRQVNGQHLFYSAASGTAGTTISFGTPKLTIAQTGQVLINDTAANAYAKFQVNATSAEAFAITNTSAAATDVGNSMFFWGTTGYNNMASIGSFWDAASNSNAYLQFKTRGSGTLTERMRITSAGNVGIGTSSPVQPFQLGQVSVISQDANSMYIGANFGSSTGGNYIKSQYANQIHFDSATGFINFKVAGSGTAGNTISYTTAMTISNTGAVVIAGSLSKGSGSFRIEHPLESLSKTHQLVHSFIEGPQADLIYRGKLTLVNGKAQANIDEVSTMTDGTFQALCREVQCFTTNESGWDLVKGKVIGNIIYIESQNANSSDEISWMVIGERKDKHMMDTEWTDDNGKVIVEPLKPIEPSEPITN